MNRSAYLVLENGTVFEGKAFGAEKETTGELVFTTAMTGYLETLTDPSYFGQVVLQTFPLIGNYGVIASDFETDSPCLKGYIVREWCQEPSNFRCEGNLDAFLKEKNVPGICGIDTRALTRIVREVGVMACRIQYTPEVTDELLDELKSYRITKAVESTTIAENEFFPAEHDPQWNVVLMDFGAKHNIGRQLNKRGCNLTVVRSSRSSPTAACRCSASASAISCSRSPEARRLRNSNTVTAAPTSPSRTRSPARCTSPPRTTATRSFPKACLPTPE